MDTSFSFIHKIIHHHSVLIVLHFQSNLNNSGDCKTCSGISSFIHLIISFFFQQEKTRRSKGYGESLIILGFIYLILVYHPTTFLYVENRAWILSSRHVQFWSVYLKSAGLQNLFATATWPYFTRLSSQKIISHSLGALKLVFSTFLHVLSNGFHVFHQFHAEPQKDLIG